MIYTTPQVGGKPYTTKSYATPTPAFTHHTNDSHSYHPAKTVQVPFYNSTTTATATGSPESKAGSAAPTTTRATVTGGTSQLALSDSRRLRPQKFIETLFVAALVLLVMSLLSTTFG
jgi:hypothetical protein